MNIKICRICGLEKKLTNFHRNKNNKDGLHTECKECAINYNKIHKEEIKEYNKKRYVRNKNRFLLQNKNWRKLNPSYSNDYKKLRRTIDNNFKIIGNLRHRINLALKNNIKYKNIKELLGCSVEFLKKHLESQFTKGMTWDNYGEWHVDHIKQCCTFDLSKLTQQEKCFNYKNLRPLWAKDNLERPKRD
jgi:hypothetical protein